MLVHQAAYQFQLYTGRAAPLEVMEQALLDTIERVSQG
jgi:shikimate 5-dehydrogenase